MRSSKLHSSFFIRIRGTEGDGFAAYSISELDTNKSEPSHIKYADVVLRRDAVDHYCRSYCHAATHQRSCSCGGEFLRNGIDEGLGADGAAAKLLESKESWPLTLGWAFS